MEPNSFTKTSFCNVQIDNITTNEAKEYILNQMSILCSGIKFNSRYAKVYNEQYSKNLKNPHIFCLKSSGSPYLLFLSQINNTNYCFLIDKKTNEKYPYPKILIVPYDFSNDLYKGTLLECELIRDKNRKWSLGINDIYYDKATNMSKIIIIDRQNSIHSILKEEYKENEYSKTCPIFAKKYFDYKEIDFVQNNFIPKLPYNIRGFYFVPMRTDYSKILYLFPRDKEQISKKQNVKKDIFIFRIMKTMKPDVYELYLKDNDNLVKKGIALVQTTGLSHKLLSFFENKNQMSEVKVECKLNEEFKKWVPLKLSSGEISSIYDL
tara:strand:+ start:2800 stop:3765 length:966 start_codon:yes stop_codon:yes gene_type:complete